MREITFEITDDDDAVAPEIVLLRRENAQLKKWLRELGWYAEPAEYDGERSQ
jgi:hypothetical protein